MTKRQADIRKLVHSPAELSQEYVRWAENLRDTPGVPFGVSAVDKIVMPFHPGDMVVFCGRPGSGKSSALVFLARQEAKRIVARGKKNEECVVFVTWEQVTEEITAMMETTASYSITDIVWGRVPIEDVIKQSIKRVELPVWIIGESLESGLDTPRMFPENVFAAIESIKTDFKLRPTLLLFDYIQLIPIPHQADRFKQVMEATVRCKEMAKRLACPVAIAVQARQEIDDRAIKIPTLRDGQHSSQIGQTADKFFGLWRPWITEPHHSFITVAGQELEVTQELLIMAMCKQRFAEPSHVWSLYFQPQWLRLCAMETAIEERFLRGG